jgi:hypothetical protein
MVQFNELENLSAAAIKKLLISKLDSIMSVICVDYDDSSVEILQRGQQAGHFDAGQFIRHENVVYFSKLLINSAVQEILMNL